MQKYVLSVDGMSCSHCENRVKKTVGALEGVKSVDVSLKEKTVTVEADTALNQIEAAIEDLGYTVNK
jgi:copper chaperone